MFVYKPTLIWVFLSALQPSDPVLESMTARLVLSPLALDCSASVLNCINKTHLNTEFVLDRCQKIQRVISPTGNRKHISAQMELGNSYQPEQLHFRIFFTLSSKTKQKQKKNFTCFTQLERNRPKPQRKALVFMHVSPKTDTRAQLPHLRQHNACINLLKSSPTHACSRALCVSHNLSGLGGDLTPFQ